MAVPPISTRLLKGEELYEMGGSGRWELVNGEVVEMSPTKPQHGHYEYLVARRVGDYIAEGDLVTVEDILPGFNLAVTDLFAANV